jgi:hypothetical protein
LFAKKELLLKIYGSDLYLEKRGGKFPYAALAAKGGAASAANETLILVPRTGVEPARENPTASSRLRVYRFRHLGVFLILTKNVKIVSKCRVV